MIDILKLAREAEIDVLEVESERASKWPATPEGLAKFAELVLEEAAKKCDESAWTHPNAAMLGPEQNSLKCATAIRAMKPNAGVER